MTWVVILSLKCNITMLQKVKRPLLVFVEGNKCVQIQISNTAG